MAWSLMASGPSTHKDGPSGLEIIEVELVPPDENESQLKLLPVSLPHNSSTLSTHRSVAVPVHTPINMSVHLSAIESNHEWLDSRVPNGFWHERRNRVTYMNWLGTKLGFVRYEDWYQIRNQDFRRNRERPC